MQEASASMAPVSNAYSHWASVGSENGIPVILDNLPRNLMQSSCETISTGAVSDVAVPASEPITAFHTPLLILWLEIENPFRTTWWTVAPEILTPDGVLPMAKVPPSTVAIGIIVPANLTSDGTSTPAALCTALSPQEDNTAATAAATTKLNFFMSIK